jgi:hypothetical protein
MNVMKAQVKMTRAFFSRPKTSDPKKSTEAEPQQQWDASCSQKDPADFPPRLRHPLPRKLNAEMLNSGQWMNAPTSSRSNTESGLCNSW